MILEVSNILCNKFFFCRERLVCKKFLFQMDRKIMEVAAAVEEDGAIKEIIIGKAVTTLGVKTIQG